jgi:hypothetical protein
VAVLTPYNRVMPAKSAVLTTNREGGETFAYLEILDGDTARAYSKPSPDEPPVEVPVRGLGTEAHERLKAYYIACQAGDSAEIERLRTLLHGGTL